MEDRLEYAKARLEEACRGNNLNDILYWRGYVDGVAAMVRDAEHRSA